jgi:hypothetical protein
MPACQPAVMGPRRRAAEGGRGGDTVWGQDLCGDRASEPGFSGS